MPEELKPDANNANDPSSLEGAIASSPEAQQQTQETQTPPAKQGETQEQTEQQQQAAPPEPPFHEHPRWKEMQEEKNYWREMAMKLQQQPSQQPPKQPEVMGNTPEEREFWRQVDDRARIQAEKIRQETQPQIQAAQAEFARMKVVEFRRNHSDVKPNTPDEGEIANLIRQGYDPDHAYWAVMGPRGVQTAKQQATQQVKQQMQVKRQANVEGSGVPSQSGLSAPKKSFIDDLKERADKENAWPI